MLFRFKKKDEIRKTIYRGRKIKIIQNSLTMSYYNYLYQKLFINAAIFQDGHPILHRTIKESTAVPEIIYI